MIQFPGKTSDFLKIGVTAAARGDVELVREILKARPQWISRIGSHGRTMLWEAAHKGKLNMVKYLVRRKADIDACGTHYTPYFVEVSCYCIARFKKHHDVADFLLSKGAKQNIHTAAFLGDLSEVKKYLRAKKSRINEGHPQYVMAPKGMDVDFVIEPARWATPLCYALRGGDIPTVEFLIEKGAQIAGIERSLFIAANDEYEMVKLLLENGANPSHANDVYADEGKLYELANTHGVKTSKSASNEELVYLCRGDRGGNPQEVQRFLNLGADVNHQDHKGKTALHRAAKSGFLPAMKILIEHGASVELEDHHGNSALLDAAISTIKNLENKKAAIRLLIRSGANRDHANNKGQDARNLLKRDTRFDSHSISAVLRK